MNAHFRICQSENEGTADAHFAAFEEQTKRGNNKLMKCNKVAICAYTCMPTWCAGASAWAMVHKCHSIHLWNDTIFQTNIPIAIYVNAVQWMKI